MTGLLSLKSKSVEDGADPLSNPDAVNPEAYGRTYGPNIVLCYIKYAFFICCTKQPKTMCCMSIYKLECSEQISSAGKR